MAVFCLTRNFERVIGRYSQFLRVLTVAMLMSMGIIGWAGATPAQSTMILYGLLDVGFSCQRVQTGSDPATF